MAVACPVDLDTVRLRNEVQSIYARVASAPDGEFHFHRGAEYAAGLLRYDPLALARLPSFAVESFAGVGNPLRMGPLAAGSTVVDVGCGAGTDLLLAASAVGPRGRAIGVDMTDTMLRKADLGFRGVEVRERFDPFQGTSKEKVARKYRVSGVNVHGAKPGASP